MPYNVGRRINRAGKALIMKAEPFVMERVVPALGRLSPDARREARIAELERERADARAAGDFWREHEAGMAVIRLRREQLDKSNARLRRRADRDAFWEENGGAGGSPPWLSWWGDLSREVF